MDRPPLGVTYESNNSPLQYPQASTLHHLGDYGKTESEGLLGSSLKTYLDLRKRLSSQTRFPFGFFFLRDLNEREEVGNQTQLEQAGRGWGGVGSYLSLSFSQTVSFLMRGERAGNFSA